MSVETQPSPTGKKRDYALKRHIGLVGLTWASMGSIIGSGWLFAPQEALQVAGPAVLISWVIGGIAIVILALVHAELGGMYPVSGGTARFPHYAFGGRRGRVVRLVRLAERCDGGTDRGLGGAHLHGPLRLRGGLDRP